jgi:hypothetical protein
MKKMQISFCLMYVVTGVSLLLTSCYGSYAPADPYIVNESRQKENYYYASSTQNVPLLEQKNDLSLALHGSFGDRQKGVDIHGAFNPAKNIGIMLSYSSIKNDGDVDNDIVHIKHFELGPGYFKKISPFFHFETYGGVGFGTASNRHYTGNSKITSVNFFLQPAISVSNTYQTLQFAVVSKFSLNNFKIADTSFNNDREPFVTSQMKIISDNPSQVFWEPGFVFRAGWKEFVFQATYSISTDITNKELYRSKNSFSLGMMLRINTEQKSK